MKFPIVLLPTDIKMFGEQPFCAIGKKYISAVRNGAHCLPLAMLVGCTTQMNEYLDIACGVVFPGSPANVHPRHFGQAVHNPDLPLDPARDATTLPLLRAVIDRGIPLLAICRGIQELNVAMGGSLHQAVHELPNTMDHREDGMMPLSQQYAPKHPIQLTSYGLQHTLFNTQTIQVNSLHGQGIDRLAEGLEVEAKASDGVIEAVRVKDAKAFALGVQFHPEWDIDHNLVGQVIFKAFGQACTDYARRNHATTP